VNLDNVRINGGMMVQWKTCGKKIVVTAFLAILWMAMAVQVVAVEFSADFVMKSPGEILPVKGKTFVKNGLIRHEVSERGDRQVTIVRPDKGVIWVLNADDKMYFEVAYQESDRRFDSWTPEEEKKAKYLGKETVSGVTCKKFELVEEGHRSVYWVAENLSFPLKIESQDGLLEYKNLKEGAANDTLFQPPADFERITMDGPAPTPPAGPAPAPPAEGTR
jgi:hypothetical protein